MTFSKSSSLPINSILSYFYRIQDPIISTNQKGNKKEIEEKIGTQRRLPESNAGEEALLLSFYSDDQ